MTNPKLYKHREKADQIRSRYTEQLEHIRANADLSDDGRQRRIAEVYKAVKTELNGLWQTERQDLSARFSNLEQQMFGAASGGYAVDSATRAISARDASERANQLTGPDEAASLLRRAEADRDELLARAVARRCVEMSDSAPTRQVGQEWDKVAGAFVDARPGLEPVVEELAEIESLSKNQIISPYSVPAPHDVAQHYLNQDLSESAKDWITR
jgi:hypothetical protein